MSVPQESKKTTSHKVVKVSYDTDNMQKFMMFNVFLSIVLLFMVFNMTEVIESQEDKITQLAKMVNELTYSIEKKTIGRSGEVNWDDQISQDFQAMEEIRQEIRLANRGINQNRAQTYEVDLKIRALREEIYNLTVMVKEQSKSSWEMKKIIGGIKDKVESLGSMFGAVTNKIESIFDKIQIPRPDFESITGSIKDTFSDIKNSMGSMFGGGKDQNDQNTQSTQNKKKDDGEFDGIKDRFRRGSRSYRSNPQANTQQTQF